LHHTGTAFASVIVGKSGIIVKYGKLACGLASSECQAASGFH